MMSTNIHILKACEYCGAEFDARTTVTRFCCQRCRTKMYKKHLNNPFLAIETPTSFQNTRSSYSPFDYLTVKEASYLIGCGTSTIYDKIKKGKLQSINFNQRKTRVLRQEIEILLYGSKTRILPFIFRVEKIQIKDCWTISEIIKLYGLSCGTLYNKLKKQNISKVKRGKSVYISKEVIRKLFGVII